MKGRCLCILAILILLVMSGLAQAQLTVIGTAAYDVNGTPGDPNDDVTCNLIWDDDSNGNSVVWLDYSSPVDTWVNQQDWAAGFEAQLTYDIDPQYTVTWYDPAWRLPNTVDRVYEYSCDGTATSATVTYGYYFTNSEMGHLYYTELGNPGHTHMSGGSCELNSTWSFVPPYELQNIESFQNLIASWYWSGTGYAANPDNAWHFHFDGGYQGNYGGIVTSGYGLALRSGQVVNGSIPTLSEWGQTLLVVMMGVSRLGVTQMGLVGLGSNLYP